MNYGFHVLLSYTSLSLRTYILHIADISCLGPSLELDVVPNNIQDSHDYSPSHLDLMVTSDFRGLESQFVHDSTPNERPLYR